MLNSDVAYFDHSVDSVMACYFCARHFTLKETRLPFNLRRTTSECVQFVTRGHFRSRDKDGGTPFDLPYS